MMVAVPIQFCNKQSLTKDVRLPIQGGRFRQKMWDRAVYWTLAVERFLCCPMRETPVDVNSSSSCSRCLLFVVLQSMAFPREGRREVFRVEGSFSKLDFFFQGDLIGWINHKPLRGFDPADMRCDPNMDSMVI